MGRGRGSEHNSEEGDTLGGEEADVGGTRTKSAGGRGRRAESERSGGRGATMSRRGHRIPNGEAPAAVSLTVLAGGPGNGKRPLAFLGNTQGNMT